MRVIAGVHRGRRLVGPKGQALRPTSDRVKEALFDILADRIAGSRVLDLCAGTGALGVDINDFTFMCCTGAVAPSPRS